jgi:cellulose synthase/poly-beta-1,6-N-acetylglucosamine synthase-like glycosyltransferase
VLPRSLDRRLLAGGVGLALPSVVLFWVLPAIYFVLLLVGQLAILVWLGRVARFMPAIAPAAPAGPLPKLTVSVIIPARNEREQIGHCLDDLRSQDWVALGGEMEVVVVDGGSSDGTEAVARSHPLRPTVMAEPPLPSGWVGKVWACHQGALGAKGDLLLFLDADVRLAPEAVRMAVLEQGRTHADLVSFAAQIDMTRFWDRVVMPLFVQFVLLYFALVRVDAGSKVPDLANGQFMCFSRAGYQRCGGHERVRGALLEDVRLAQEVRRSGGTVRMYTASSLVSTPMYASRSEMQEGILKSLQGTSLSTAVRSEVALLVALLFLLPFPLLVLPLFGLLAPIWAYLSAAVIVVTALKQVGLQGPFGAPPAYGLLYPLGSAFFVVLFLRSAARGRSGGQVDWKGRSYPRET